ncbi:TonB-dependent receptor [Parapedomonas caeni]
MTRTLPRAASAASTLTLALLAAPIAQAQTPQTVPPGEALDELVVTARRREESLQSVPVAVTALGRNALADMQATSLGDIEAAVPNLALHVGDAQNAVVYLRGVGQIDSLAFADPGVGVYLDDVYLGRAQGAFLDIFDVERVEVLRGPQGTLYGRNTIGGAVKVVTSQPGDDWKLRGGLTLGSYDQFDAQLMASGPLVPGKLYAKAGIAWLSRDGYADNSATGKDDGDKETLAWRTSLVFTPSDSLRLELSGDGSRDHPDTSRTPARMTSVFGVPASTDPFEIDANFNDLNKLAVKGISGKAVWSATDALTLTSITAYRTMDYDAHLDLDATAADFFGVFVFEDQKQFSQEFQLSYESDRLNVVTGLYYFREHDETESGIFGPVIAFVSNSLNDQINRSYAAYGQASYKLTDALSLTAGLRYTHEKKSFARIQEFFGAATPLVPVLGTGARVTDVDVKADWSNLSPKFGIDYQINQDVLLYVSASRGFKSGGFDGRSNSADQALPFDPETLWSYEAGLKSTLMDGRVTLNLAAFYNDYKDLQLSSFTADENGAFSALFTNAGKAHMAGLEAEMHVKLTQALRLRLSGAYLDAQYDEFIGAGGADIAGQREMVNAPKWSFTFGGQYRQPIGTWGYASLNADVAYRSKTYPTVSSSEVLAQDGYALVNAGLAFETMDGVWQLALGVKNLTDKNYVTHGFDLSDSLGYQLGYYGAPRTWSLSLRVDY